MTSLAELELLSRDNISYSSLFWSHVEKTDGCWLWTASCFENGYGQTTGRIDGKVYTCKAHRASWELTYGPIRDSLFVLHRCDVRRCVNPAHLFLGTHQENMADRDSKGRQARNKNPQPGEANGFSKLTASEVDEIRLCLETLPATKTAIAKAYSVHRSTVYKIARGISWM